MVLFYKKVQESPFHLQIFTVHDTVALQQNGDISGLTLVPNHKMQPTR